MDSDASSPIVRLNIGGSEFYTTVDTLTIREPQSLLAAMFSGRHTVYQDPEKGCVFVDRDGMHFRHILNWLRDGKTPKLSDSEYLELLSEAKYYQLLGLVDKINEVLNKKEDARTDTDLTRSDIIKYVQSNHIKFRGVNLSGLDLSKLDLSKVDLSYACLKNVLFSRANLRGAWMAGANLFRANLQGACLIDCIFVGANLRSANLNSADLTNANLEGANLEGASIKGANLKGANLSNVNLQNTQLEKANF